SLVRLQTATVEAGVATVLGEGEGEPATSREHVCKSSWLWLSLRGPAARRDLSPRPRWRRCRCHGACAGVSAYPAGPRRWPCRCYRGHGCRRRPAPAVSDPDRVTGRNLSHKLSRRRVPYSLTNRRSSDFSLVCLQTATVEAGVATVLGEREGRGRGEGEGEE